VFFNNQLAIKNQDL